MNNIILAKNHIISVIKLEIFEYENTWHYFVIESDDSHTQKNQWMSLFWRTPDMMPREKIRIVNWCELYSCALFFDHLDAIFCISDSLWPRLYPGQGFEQYVDSVIAGGDLLAYKAEKKKQPTGCSQAMFIEANVEDCRWQPDQQIWR